MQAMIFHAARVHRLKSSQTDMQRDLRRFDSPLSDAGKNFRGEVQPGRWRGHRTPLPRIDGLVSFSVARPVGPVNIWRKRHMPQALDRTPKILNRPEPNRAFAETVPGHDLGLQFILLAEEQFLAHSDFADRAEPGTPISSLSWETWRVSRTSTRPLRNSLAAGLRALTDCALAPLLLP